MPQDLFPVPPTIVDNKHVTEFWYPPPINEPEAKLPDVLQHPPPMKDKQEGIVLILPPPIVERRDVAELRHPPPMNELLPLFVFKKPPPTNE
jgi:hypothetical protein